MKTFGVEIEISTINNLSLKAGSLISLRVLFGRRRCIFRFLLSGSSSNQGGTVKVTGIGRNSMQGDIRLLMCWKKWARPFAGATIIFPHAW